MEGRKEKHPPGAVIPDAHLIFDIHGRSWRSPASRERNLIIPSRSRPRRRRQKARAEPSEVLFRVDTQSVSDVARS